MKHFFRRVAIVYLMPLWARTLKDSYANKRSKACDYICIPHSNILILRKKCENDLMIHTNVTLAVS